MPGDEAVAAEQRHEPRDPRGQQAPPGSSASGMLSAARSARRAPARTRRATGGSERTPHRPLGLARARRPERGSAVRAAVRPHARPPAATSAAVELDAPGGAPVARRGASGGGRSATRVSRAPTGVARSSSRPSWTSRGRSAAVELASQAQPAHLEDVREVAPDVDRQLDPARLDAPQPQHDLLVHPFGSHRRAAARPRAARPGPGRQTSRTRGSGPTGPSHDARHQMGGRLAGDP